MTVNKVSDTYHIITFDNGDILHLVGTAHVSKDRVDEVKNKKRTP